MEKIPGVSVEEGRRHNVVTWPATTEIGQGDESRGLPGCDGQAVCRIVNSCEAPLKRSGRGIDDAGISVAVLFDIVDIRDLGKVTLQFIGRILIDWYANSFRRGVISEPRMKGGCGWVRPMLRLVEFLRHFNVPEDWLAADYAAKIECEMSKCSAVTPMSLSIQASSI